MSFQISSDLRVYAQVTHPYDGLFPNTVGISSIAGTDIVPCASFSVNSQAGLVQSNAKTLGLGRPVGMAGRRTATWEAEFPLQPSGAAGTVCNLDPILQAAFSNPPTISAGVSVTYTFPASGLPSGLSFFIFQTSGANVPQYAVRGCLVDSMTISSSGEEATVKVSGPCSMEIDSINFASYDTADKGGLTTFPSEPGSPTAIGGSIVGFLGPLTVLNGVSTHSVQSWSISPRFNRGLQYAFGQRTASIPTAKLRDVSFSVSVFSENTAALNTLRFKPYNSTPVAVSFGLGVGAGNIFTFSLPKSILPQERIVDSDGVSVIQWDSAQGYITAVGQNDELTLVCT